MEDIKGVVSEPQESSKVVEEVPHSGSTSTQRKNKKSKTIVEKKLQQDPETILSNRSEQILSNRSEQLPSDRSDQILSDRSNAIVSAEPKVESKDGKQGKGKSKKEKVAAPPPPSELALSLKRVEEKLKLREKVKFTILSIELTNLPSAHRFTKNCPWIKGFYGKNYSWVAEYVEGTSSTSAFWKDLNWSLSLERNLPDRSDLVITVCSKYLIIGRYVLTREEFADIPNPKSGYFEISGEIINGGGMAGNIKLLCQRSQTAETVPVVVPPINAEDGIAAGDKNLTIDEESFDVAAGNGGAGGAIVENHNNSQLSPTKLQQTLAVLTATPHESAEPPVVVVMIQLISIAVVDLKAVHMIENNSPQVTIECSEWVGITDVVRGAGIAARWNGLNWKFLCRKDSGIVVTVKSNSILVGKVFISFDEIMTSAPKIGTTIFEIIKHLTNGKEISGRVKINLTMNLSHDVAYMADPTVSQLLPSFNSPAKSVPNASTTQKKLNTGHDINWSPQVMTTPKSSVTTPFMVLVQSLTVLDVVKIHYLASNSLSVNAACGSWGCSTEEVANAGHFAHWIHLNWKITVTDGSYFRITVWSKGTTIGSASLNVEQLLGMPTDTNGNTELFAKLLNNRSEIVGKVKIACRYEVCIESPQKHLNLIPPPPVNEEDLLLRDDVQFPLLVVVKIISLYDLTSVHKLVKNTPRVKIICDRKSATTTVMNGGDVAAKWTNLNWAMIVREESNVVIEVTSGAVLIGTVVLNPVELTTIPVNSAGFTEMKLQINNKRASTGKLQILFEVQNLDEGAPAPAGVNGPADRYYENDEAKDDVMSGSGMMPLFHDASAEIASRLKSDATLPYLMNGRGNNTDIKVFDPNLFLPSNIGIDSKMAFKVHIHEIDITNLVKVHTFGKNSPFVSAACGKWTAVTKPIENVVGSCYWTNLGWEFILRNNVNLRLIVNSRTIAVGTSSFNCNTLISPVSDHNGIKRIVVNIDNGLVAVGQIKLTYGITVMDARTDKHLLDDNMSLVDNKSQYRRNGASTADESEYIDFPFNLTIVDISTVELKSAHFLVKNRPRVKLLCDQFYSETEENLSIYGGFDVSIWKDVNWTFMVTTTESKLKVFVDSGGSIIGSGTIDAKQLVLIPKDNIGIRECVISISNTVDGLQTTGKVKLSMKFANINPNFDNDSHNESTLLPPLATHSYASGQYFPTPAPQLQNLQQLSLSQQQQQQQQQQQPQPYRNPGSIVGFGGPPSVGQNSIDYFNGGGGSVNELPSHPMYGSVQSTPPQQLRKQQQQAQQSVGYANAPIQSGIIDNSMMQIGPADEFKMKICSISAIDLLAVHNFAANSPVANIACGKFSGATEECLNGGKQVAWDNLNFVYTFESNATLRILLSSKGKTIGNCNISRVKLLNGKRNKNEMFTIFSELMQRDSIPAGKIKIVYDVGFL